jgi:hypothetical protein
VQNPALLEIGSGKIDMDIADFMRGINRVQGLDEETGVREHCGFISEHSKPDVRKPLQRRRGFTVEEWAAVERVKLLGDEFANRERVDFMIKYVRSTEAGRRANAQANPIVIATGGGSQSATLYDCMKRELGGAMPGTRIVLDESTE